MFRWKGARKGLGPQIGGNRHRTIGIAEIAHHRRPDRAGRGAGGGGPARRGRRVLGGDAAGGGCPQRDRAAYAGRRGARRERCAVQRFNVRTRVHEYGRRAGFWVVVGVVWFANFANQRGVPAGNRAAPVAITPTGVDLRFGDGMVDWQRGRLVCVR